MSINLALSSALSGLKTNQKALDLVSRNIANVNTPGYTKKIFNQESVVLAGVGSGVQVSEIQRRVDYGLIDELNRENAQLEKLSVKSQFFDQMQNLFGKPADNNSIAHIMETLAGEVEMLALDPDKTEQHMTVVQRAQDVSHKLNSMGDHLQQLRLDADQDIQRSVQRVNTLLEDINDLNKEIAYTIATSRDSTDLTDKRDMAVAELQSLMNVTVFTRDSGELTVYTEGGDILVDREVKQVSYSPRSSYSAWTTKGGNDVQGITVNGHDITEDITDGRISALIEMRDSILPNYQAQLDELSQELRDTVNAVNNRGTSFPNLATEFVGTRTFLDSAAQTMQLDADHDTVVALFDGDGNQVAQTTMKDIVNLIGGGDLETPTTIDDVAAALQTWLQSGSGATPPGPGLGSATVSVNSDGVLDIKLNDNSVGLAFKDVNTTAGTDPASWTAEDASVTFDADADGNGDITHAGFSSFFGLNDVFTDGGRAEWAWDSGIKSETWRPFSGGTLNFSNASGLVVDSLTLTGTETVEEIAAAINSDPGLKGFLEAEVVPEGEGVRLRIKQRDGSDLMVTQAGGGTGLMDSLGLKPSSAGLANAVSVKKEIADNPSLLSRGAVLYNSDTKEYTVSSGDNSTANAMAEALRAGRSFDSAGGQVSTNSTLSDYAALLLSQNASAARANETKLDYQVSLVDSLSLKNAEISAVNLDEELAELIVYQQSYAASAKVISTVSDLFDILNSIV
ncbi:flagellar hook-associated protein FlgK [Roseospira marina]|uniref:Flagellar hook-associated protein 1 n=1 Tax=Roseospira marina TaxID=140057 RepID=A0A5M6ICQ2_9PROT|nr:flagellar hook-associated protein FlgK [Roseospira marina]KAA5605757.1 flagellar hook-associated protein FlgK [Roseospira marina]MBB4313561.1 flagellar hook-associated protein 1 FlgK [Roseospira marina]MBB5086723.1 flagellar hook-associated protein 1 FlgK [Roseospira marina]